MNTETLRAVSITHSALKNTLAQQTSSTEMAMFIDRGLQQYALLSFAQLLRPETFFMPNSRGRLEDPDIQRGMVLHPEAIKTGQFLISREEELRELVDIDMGRRDGPLRAEYVLVSELMRGAVSAAEDNDWDLERSVRLNTAMYALDILREYQVGHLPDSGTQKSSQILDVLDELTPRTVSLLAHRWIRGN